MLKWRDVEAELVTFFQSLGNNVVHDSSGEPTIEYVRSREPADDDTIYTYGVNSLSLTTLARLLANNLRGAL
jgi:hypothetical protein